MLREDLVMTTSWSDFCLWIEFFLFIYTLDGDVCPVRLSKYWKYKVKKFMCKRKTGDGPLNSENFIARL